MVKAEFNSMEMWHDNIQTLIIDYVESVFERMEGEYSDADDFNDDLMEAIDCELMYYDDQWALMRAYQTPVEANFTEMVEEFTETCLTYIHAVEYDDEEDE